MKMQFNFLLSGPEYLSFPYLTENASRGSRRLISRQISQ